VQRSYVVVVDYNAGGDGWSPVSNAFASSTHLRGSASRGLAGLNLQLSFNVASSTVQVTAESVRQV
jgi:hypothetical protein